jgi:large subunit ribosomal protein L23
MDSYQVLIRPVITEKSGYQSDKLNRYTFAVDGRANKLQIKKAVEQVFSVDVVSVNVMHVQGKSRRWGKVLGRTKDWKKAIVTLRPGQTIQFFEGV